MSVCNWIKSPWIYANFIHKYPKTHHYLGTADFKEVVCRYKARHPMTSPVLGYYGKDLAHFLGVGLPREIAQMEWAMHECLLNASDQEGLPESTFLMPTSHKIALKKAVTLRVSSFDLKKIWVGESQKAPLYHEHGIYYYLVAVDRVHSFFIEITAADNVLLSRLQKPHVFSKLTSQEQQRLKAFRAYCAFC